LVISSLGVNNYKFCVLTWKRGCEHRHFEMGS